MSNIRPFKTEPTLINKLGIAFAYIIGAWIVASSDSMGGLLSIFLILGILLWAFVIRKTTIKYFIRFHLVQVLLLYISLAAALWLLTTILGLFLSLPILDMLAGYVYMFVFEYNLLPGIEGVDASAKDICVLALGFFMAVYALRGEYTELPWITDGVRHWV